MLEVKHPQHASGDAAPAWPAADRQLAWAVGRVPCDDALAQWQKVVYGSARADVVQVRLERARGGNVTFRTVEVPGDDSLVAYAGSLDGPIGGSLVAINARSEVVDEAFLFDPEATHASLGHLFNYERSGAFGEGDEWSLRAGVGDDQIVLELELRPRASTRFPTLWSWSGDTPVPTAGVCRGPLLPEAEHLRVNLMSPLRRGAVVVGQASTRVAAVRGRSRSGEVFGAELLTARTLPVNLFIALGPQIDDIAGFEALDRDGNALE